MRFTRKTDWIAGRAKPEPEEPLEPLEVRPAAPAPAELPEDEEGFRALVAKIEVRTGFPGRFYKDKCLRRRLGVRMRVRGEDTFEGYSRLLDRDPAEYEHLLDALTINVTKFFRNLETWDVVAREVVPQLFALPPEARRVWSAGCASGEETYSAAILLRAWAEANGREEELDSLRIVGTDIDRRSLEAARRAVYPELSLAETPGPIRDRWFSTGPPYHLDAAVRRSASFERRDLISELPEPGQSLILCRNVIIYFDREIQEELFRRFYDALIPGGFLVLGKVETLLGVTRSLFRPVSIRERVYRRPG